MIEYKNFLKNKLKEKKDLKETDRLQILPNGDVWRKYFDNQVLTDNEYIVYYNINNIIYLYHRYNDIIDIIGDLSDLDNPIPQTSIVDAINFVWENGGGEVDTLPTDKITAVDPELEGGETQQIINENVQSVIGDINQLDPNLLSEIDPDNLVNAINYIYLNGGENSDTTNLIYPVNPETEGGETQKIINENVQEALDLSTLEDPIPQTSIADAVNYVYDNTSNTTDQVIPVDSELEGGETQQIINQNNKTNIDGIIDGTIPININTNDVNTIDPELENGTTQEEVNKNNKEELDNINQEIVDIKGNLPDMSNYYTKSEVDALIEDLQNQINACCGLPATADITNIIPISPTTEDNIDGSINFDVNITGCSGIATASLNPASETTPITLTDGDNTGLSFSPLPAGDYTIQIYCDDTLVEESDTITIPDYVPPTDDGIIDILVPTDDTLIPAEGTDIPINDGETFNHTLFITKGSMKPEDEIQAYQNLFIVGEAFNLNEWTTASLNTYNPDDAQGDPCYVAMRKTSDVLFDTDRENVSTSINGLNWIKAIDSITLTQILPDGSFELNDTFTLSEGYSTYTYLIAKWYYFSNAGTAQVEQWGYSVRETADLVNNNTWFMKQQASNSSYSGAITFTDETNGTVTSAYHNDALVSMWGINNLPLPTDLNMVLTGTIITVDDYSDADFLLINSSYNGNGNTQLIYAKDIIYDGITRYDFVGIGTCYISFNTDLTINLIINGISSTVEINSIKKIILS